MEKSIVISERDNIAAVIEDKKVSEFFINKGDVLLNDIYIGRVENILPSIDAGFVNVGYEKMGFLHASDVIGKGDLKDKLKPKQSLLVQVVKEPTGHKGPRLTTLISLPGRFLVLMPEEKGISVSRKIDSSKERNRLKSIVSLLKPAGLGIIIRTEAENQSETEIQEDLEFLLEKWNTVITAMDTYDAPSLIYRDQDLLYKVIREACTEDVNEIIIDTSFAYHRASQLLQAWNMNKNLTLTMYKGSEPMLIATGIDKEIRTALQTKVNLPSGGYLFIQTTEALTVVDVNSGKFVSSATQAETIRKTNLEAANEIARQLRLRNIGGMIIVDFIDMEVKADKLTVLESFENALEPDKSKPQVGQLSDLGLVELTRHRQGQSLSEIFTKTCPHCNGTGLLLEEFNFATSNKEAEMRVKASKMKLTPKQLKNNIQQKESPQRQTVQINRKIQTSPSLNASLLMPKPVITKELNVRQINASVTKNILAENKFMPNFSDIIRFAHVPAALVGTRFYPNYNADVFTVLSESEKRYGKMEAVAPKTVEIKQPIEQVKQIEEPKQTVVTQEETVETEKPRRRTTRTTGTSSVSKPRRAPRKRIVKKEEE
ncbi:MAG: Rne/Rng family ribonuclease [Candidatus Gastranaerophilales bacterium]|nr:Rne/Rng family ribonuclease [Candidatus Gastranaerophilales bacterium]